MKILLATESHSESALLCRYIERLGGIPLLASSGTDALDLLAREHPDLVLLDEILPDIAGHEVARRLRARETGGAWTPIIFMSAPAREENLEKGLAAGGDDYLFKPISEVVLAAKVRSMYRIVQMRTSLVVLARKLDAANQELQRLSSSDGLTGIANRRFFDETFDREWRRCRRNHTELALIMCDVDEFKRYNDGYGHPRGDECLKQVAQALTGSLDRGGDTLARYGGEEFAIILPDTTPLGALKVAERAREAVLSLALPHVESAYGQVTVSLGVASAFPVHGEVAADLINRADSALYMAKHSGRNRACAYPQGENNP